MAAEGAEALPGGPGQRDLEWYMVGTEGSFTL